MEQVLIVDQWWSREEKAVSPDKKIELKKLLEQNSQLIAKNRTGTLKYILSFKETIAREMTIKDGTASSMIQNKRGMVAKRA